MAGLGYLMVLVSIHCVVAVPVLFLTFIIRAKMKRGKKWFAISAAICGFLVLPLFVGGCILVGSDEEFQAEYSGGTHEPPSLETAASTAETTLKATPEPPVIETTTVPPETTQATTTTTEPPETTTTEPPVTFEDIYLAFKDNELRGKDLYKGNRYTITCQVQSIGTGGLNGLMGNISVTATVYYAGRECILWCSFDEDTQRESLVGLSRGDTITFEGTCMSWGNWTDCEIVE